MKKIVFTIIIVLSVGSVWGQDILNSSEITKKQKKVEAKLNKKLIAILDTIHQNDQKYRLQLVEAEKNYGYSSKEVSELWDTIHKHDSINLITVKEILDTRGWLGEDIIGSIGNSTLFLVIQHADHETQGKYLPMLQDAVKKGNAKASNLALLEDRFLLGEGKKQIYGSQLFCNLEGKCFVQPLEDPDNVDKRRAEVGLGKLQDYVAQWNIVWDVEKYKKQLPELEEYLKNMIFE